MTTFIDQPAIVAPRYDNTSDFPSEPAGWGVPGEIRHAEAIGHGVWVAEHPDDALTSDELIAGSQAARVDLENAVAASKAARLFEEPEPEKCPIPTCDRSDHPTWEMCEDATGHTWFQGDNDATKETHR